MIIANLRCLFLGICLTVIAPSWSAFGSDCRTLEIAYDVLIDQSIYDVDLSGEFQEDLWELFLEKLDPMKYYLQERHVTFIKEKYVAKIPLDNIEGVCQQIEGVSSVLATQIEEVSGYIKELIVDPLLYVDEETISYTKNLRMLVDSQIVPWLDNIEELKDRWLLRLLFERYKLYKHSYDEYLDITQRFLATEQEKMADVDFAYGSFIKALYESVDPGAGWTNISSHYPMYRDIAVPDRQYNYRSRSMSLPVSLDDYTIFPQFFKIFAEKALRNPLAMNRYYRLTSNDLIVNLYNSDKASDYHELMVLRSGLTEYSYDRSLSLPPGNRSLDFLANNFFSYIVKMRNIKTKVKKRVGYINVGQLAFNKSIKDYQSAVLELLEKRLHMFARDHSEAVVSTVVMDFRGSAINNFGKAMVLLGVLLPDQPVFQLTQRHNSDIKTHIMTTNKEAIRYDGLLVVLVDHSTAGYSELIVSALQSHGRALVVGEGLGTNTSARLGRLYYHEEPGEYGYNFTVTKGVFYDIYGNLLAGRGVKPDFSLPKERGFLTYASYAIPKTFSGYFKNSLPPLENAAAYQNQMLASSTIDTLRQRSFQRLTTRIYHRKTLSKNAEDGSRELLRKSSQEKRHTFEEAFQIRKEDLYAQAIKTCHGELCGSVSLDAMDFSQDMDDADGVVDALKNQFDLYKHNPELGRRSDSLVLFHEDPILYETINIAADYENMMAHKPLGRYRIQIPREDELRNFEAKKQLRKLPPPTRNR
ncbi:MAG: S41 family peptidase [Proteobacteria bacterium]|nr:S41 family peptidase [Pseudomonadota bacterium]